MQVVFLCLWVRIRGDDTGRKTLFVLKSNAGTDVLVHDEFFPTQQLGDQYLTCISSQDTSIYWNTGLKKLLINRASHFCRVMDTL